MSTLDRRAPHEELTDPDNAKVNATLNPRSIRKVALYNTKMRFIDRLVRVAEKTVVGEKLSEKEQEELVLKHPSDGLMQEFLELSSANGGEHRKDLVEAMKASNPSAPGLSLMAAPTAPPPDDKGRKGKGL